jgi:hypothetical protein
MFSKRKKENVKILMKFKKKNIPNSNVIDSQHYNNANIKPGHIHIFDYFLHLKYLGITVVKFNSFNGYLQEIFTLESTAQGTIKIH